MKKLLAYHDVRYIQGRKSKSPDGAPYGFANRRDGTLLVESKRTPGSGESYIASAQATLPSTKTVKFLNYWRFDPDPCSVLRAMARFSGTTCDLTT